MISAVIGQLIGGHDVALWSGGLPGVGATALALIVAQHPELTAHFLDGVLWASCGEGEDALACMAKWADVLGVDLSNCFDAATCSLALHNAIGDRRMLLVIDSPGFDEAVLLRCGGENCAHLLTTRDEIIARDFAKPDNLITVTPLTKDVTLELLRTLAPQVAADEPLLMEQVAQLTAGIPLVIQLLGAFLAAPEPCVVENLIVAPRFSASGPAVQQTSSRRRLLLAQQRLGNGELSTATVQRAIALCVAALPGVVLRAFRCFSAFAPAPNTFNQTAIQAICQCDAQVVSLLVSRRLLEVSAVDPDALVGQSQLRRRTHATRSTDGVIPPQARMTIRPLIAGISLVRSDPQAPSRHRDYYLALARECREHGVNVGADYGQIRHACATLPDGPAVLEFAWAMRFYHARHNLQHEQLAWARRAGLSTGGSKRTPKPGPGTASKDVLSTDGYVTLATLLDQIGAYYDALGQPEQAAVYHRRALNLHELLPDPSNTFGVGHSLHRLGLTYSQLGRRDQAISLLQSALPMLDGKDARDPAGMALLLADLGALYNSAGRPDKALDHLQRALTIYDDPQVAPQDGQSGAGYSAAGYSAAGYSAGDAAGLVNTLDQLGKACMKLGRYSRARALLQRAVENRERALPGDQAGIAATLCDMGECFTALGQHDLALSHLQRSLILREKQPANKVGIAQTLNALGALYQAISRPDQALVTFQRALPMGEEVGDQAVVAQSCTGIGVALSSKGRRDEALGYLQRAMTVLEPSAASAAADGAKTVAHTAASNGTSQVAEHSVQLAAVLNHIGSLYLDRNEPTSALEYLLRSLRLRESLTPGDQSALAQTLNNIGAAYSKLNQPEPALQCLNRTLTIHAQLGDNAGESAARCNLAMLYLLQGQHDKAVSSMMRAVELDREINSPDLTSHQALLRRFEAQRTVQPRTRIGESKESKPTFLERLRKHN